MAFICPLCREGFRDKETLENHAMAVHGVNAEGLQRLMMLMQGSHWLNNATKDDEGRDSGELCAQYSQSILSGTDFNHSWKSHFDIFRQSRVSEER